MDSAEISIEITNADANENKGESIDSPCLSPEHEALIDMCKSLIKADRFKDAERLLMDALRRYHNDRRAINATNASSGGDNGNNDNYRRVDTVEGLVILRELAELYKYVATWLASFPSTSSPTTSTQSQSVSTKQKAYDPQLVETMRNHFTTDLILGTLRDYFQAARQILSPDEPDLLQAGNDLAEFLSSVCHYQEAGFIYRYCLRLLEIHVGPYHPDTITSMEVLAGYFADLKQVPETVILLSKILKAYSQVEAIGADQSIVDTTKIIALETKLADILVDQNSHLAATPYFIDLCERMRRIKGDEHVETMQARLNLAENYIEASSFSTASVVLNECFEKQIDLVNRNPNVEALLIAKLSTMNDLAVLCDNTFDYERSQQLHEECIHQRSKILGKHHPDTLQSMVNFGNMLSEIGKNQQAEQLLRESLAGYLTLVELFPTDVPAESLCKCQLHSGEKSSLPPFPVSTVFKGLIACVESLFLLHTTLGQTDVATQLMDSTIAKLVAVKNIGPSHRCPLALKIMSAKGLLEYSSDTEAIEQLCTGLVSTLGIKIENYMSNRRDAALNADQEAEISATFDQQFQAYTVLAKFYHNLNLVEKEIEVLEKKVSTRKQYLRDFVGILAMKRPNVDPAAVQLPANEIAFIMDDELAELAASVTPSVEESNLYQDQRLLLEALSSQHEFAKSLVLAEDFLNFVVNVYGEMRQETLFVCKLLAEALRATGQVEAAEQRLAECFQISKALDGENSPGTLAVMLSLSGVFCELHKVQAAYELYEVCFGVSEYLFGFNDIRTLSILNNLAICSVELNDLVRARAQFEECITIGTEHFGAGHDRVEEWKRDRDRYLPPSGCCVVS